MITPIGEFFYRLAEGSDHVISRRQRVPGRCAHHGPPFLYRSRTFAKNSKTRSSSSRNHPRRCVHIEDVSRSTTSGVVTGNVRRRPDRRRTGTTMKAAQKQAYNRIDNIMIPNMYYRKDIGDRLV